MCHSLSGAKEADLDKEQEEQGDSDIIAAQAPRVPSGSVLAPTRGTSRALIICLLGAPRVLLD
jgi:hypothetical protein